MPAGYITQWAAFVMLCQFRVPLIPPGVFDVVESKVFGLKQYLSPRSRPEDRWLPMGEWLMACLPFLFSISSPVLHLLYSLQSISFWLNLPMSSYRLTLSISPFQNWWTFPPPFICFFIILPASWKIKKKKTFMAFPTLFLCEGSWFWWQN